MLQHAQEKIRIFAPWGYAPARAILECNFPFIDAIWERMVSASAENAHLRVVVDHFRESSRAYMVGGNHTCITPDSPFICGYLARTLLGGRGHTDQVIDTPLSLTLLTPLCLTLVSPLCLTLQGTLCARLSLSRTADSASHC